MPSGRRAVPLRSALVKVTLLVTDCHGGLFVGGGRPQVGLLSLDVPMSSGADGPLSALASLFGVTMSRCRRVKGGGHSAQ